jgi:protein KRI1
MESFTINKEYAAKYEAKKKRADKLWLEKQFGPIQSDAESNSSSSEDEDDLGEQLTLEIDSQIVRVIEQIKLKDPSVYEAGRQFFTETEIKKGQSSVEKKPMFLKDYHRERILGGGEEKEDAPVVVTHVMEQNKLKEDFKDAVNAEFDEGGDDKEDFFTNRVKDDEVLAKEEEDYRQFLLDSMASVCLHFLIQKAHSSDWKAYKKRIEDKPVDKNEEFLMNYVLNKGWIDTSENVRPTYEEIVNDGVDIDDTEEIEMHQDFEDKHNFRFEASYVFCVFNQ